MPRPEDNIVHVRFARAQQIAADALACLDESEREEGARLPQAAAQDYFCAHLLLRQTLSEFADIAPVDWRFAKNMHGKPFTTQAPLSFNLSHTYGMAAVVVASGCEVGIDIEKIDPHRADPIIARQMFAPDEFLLWESAQDRLSVFFQIWTLKEAVMKATGLGMSLPLHSFEVTLASSQIVHTPSGERCYCERGILDQGFAWSVAVQSDAHHMPEIQSRLVG